MQDILDRLSNPLLIVWTIISLMGLIASVMTLQTMRYEIQLNPWTLKIPGIAAMKRYDIASERVRLLAYVSALSVTVIIALGIAAEIALGVALILMLSAFTFNSLSELRRTNQIVGLHTPDPDDPEAHPNPHW